MYQKILTIQPISYYQYPVDKVIRNFKFHEDIKMIPILYHLIQQLVCPKNCHANNSVILAMPTTNQRIAKRGFDPLTILVPYLSKHWQIPIWRGVQRIDNSISQRGLSRLERQENISGAFAVTDELAVKKVLIFDDIATTGASLQELANTLLQENPQLEIQAYCLAHGSS
ncbi:MAG: ComF family protein [Moraxellaceae bacterium]|nr:ComF family protein [Moraxellaceae bacterium]